MMLVMNQMHYDAMAVGKGTFLPGTISEFVAKSYASHLYGDATLQDLPDDPPRFVINATNVQSGALWRFSTITRKLSTRKNSGTSPISRRASSSKEASAPS